MLFGVFSLLNVVKATPSKGVGRGRRAGTSSTGKGRARYYVKYTVETRAKTTYEQKFYPGQEALESRFLVNVRKRGGTIIGMLRPAAASHETAPLVAPAAPVRARTTPSSIVLEQMAARGKTLPVVEVSPHKIEAERAQYENEIAYKYERVGDKLKWQGGLDPTGYEMAVALSELGKQIASIKEDILGKQAFLRKRPEDAEALRALTGLQVSLRSLTVERDKLMTDLNRRPLADKLLRIVAIRDQMAALRKQGKEEIKADPKAWERYLRSHRAKVGHMPKGKRDEAFAALKYPPHIQAELDRLAWKLKGISGTTVKVATKKTGARAGGGPLKFGVGQHTIIPLAEEREEGAIATQLTRGEWKDLHPNGHNRFTEGNSAALLKEFDGVINNIVRGSTFGGKAPGWAKLFDLKDFADEMRSSLRVRLFQLASEYTPEMAKDNLAGLGVLDKEVGRVGGGKERNFTSFAIMRLSSHAKHLVRDALREAANHKEIEPEEMEAAESLLAQDEEGMFTRDQLRDQPLPIASPFASPDDIIAIQDVRKLISSKLGRVEALGMLSRLNLLNPVDDPKGGGGLKSWDEVAEDVRAELLKEPSMEGRRARRYGLSTQVPSTLYLRSSLMRSVGRIFAAPTKGNRGGWTNPLTPSEKLGLKEGIKALIRVVGMRQVSLPEVHAWRVAREASPKVKGQSSQPGASVPQPINADIHRVVSTGPVAEGIAHPVSGHMARQVPLLVVKPDVHSFWRQQSRAALRRPDMPGVHFDPARELDLGMDLYLSPHVTLVPGAKDSGGVPMHVRLKQMRAKHYASVWKQMSKMNSKRLARLSEMHPGTTAPKWVEGQQFAEYSRQWEAAQAASAAEVQAQVTRRENDPTVKKQRIPLDVKPLVIKLRRGTATIEGVPPEDILKMARLIIRQRDLDAGLTKADEGVDEELAALFLKLRRLLKVG